MDFVADESVARQIVERLRHEGHRVFWFVDMQPGTRDEVILEQGHQEGTVLLTSDRDFGSLVFQGGYPTAGVVLLRLAGLSMERRTQIGGVMVSRYGERLRIRLHGCHTRNRPHSKDTLG